MQTRVGRGRLRLIGWLHLCIALVTALLSLTVISAPASAAATTTTVHGYVYDAQVRGVGASYAPTKRGPPEDYVRNSSAIVDLGSRGAAARSGSVAPSASPTYDDHSLLARGARVTGPIEARKPRADAGTFSPIRWSSVAANSGNRVFWSGGSAAKEAAAEFATANGAKTLEMTAVGRTLERLPYNRATAKLWDAASAGFAATARGEANVFIGPSFRGSESVFGRIEGPILNLKGNPILQRFEDAW